MQSPLKHRSTSVSRAVTADELAGAKVCEPSPCVMATFLHEAATRSNDCNRPAWLQQSAATNERHDMARVTPGWGGASSVCGKGPWRRDAACHVWGRGSLSATAESRSGASRASCLENNSTFSQSKPKHRGKKQQQLIYWQKGKMGVRKVQKLRVNNQFSMMFPIVTSDPWNVTVERLKFGKSALTVAILACNLWCRANNIGFDLILIHFVVIATKILPWQIETFRWRCI